MYFALVPAYNEEKNIQEVILQLKKISKFKIIVIDDGSTDNTAKIVRKLGVILLQHKVNKGKAEAIKTGFKYILKNYPEVKYAVIIDSDLQYLPEEAIKILAPLEIGEADFVSGYRDWSKVPFRHRFGNFVWRNFFNFLFGTNFKDTNCGFVGLNKKAMLIMKDKIFGGYILENSMLFQAIKNRLKIKQVPVTVLYKKLSDVRRGVKIVLGVLLFIIREGFKYHFASLKCVKNLSQKK